MRDRGREGGREEGGGRRGRGKKRGGGEGGGKKREGGVKERGKGLVLFHLHGVITHTPVGRTAVQSPP